MLLVAAAVAAPVVETVTEMIYNHNDSDSDSDSDSDTMFAHSDNISSYVRIGDPNAFPSGFHRFCPWFRSAILRNIQSIWMTWYFM